MRPGANLPAIAAYNEKVVLHAIRPSGGISQTEIADRTGLAAQTVSVIVNQLLVKGEIRTAGVQHVGRGRPRTLLELVPDARFAVGIHLDPSVVTVVVLDLGGRVAGRVHSQDVLIAPPEEATEKIAVLVRDLVERSAPGQDRILGAGVATPGAVDTREGWMVTPLWMPEWDRFPIREHMSARLGMPVAFVKDTVAAVTGETWLRAGRADDSSMVFTYIGTDTGLGISIEGEAVDGVSGNGGEIGRLLVSLGATDSDDAFSGRGMDNDPAVLLRRAITSGALAGEVAESETLAGIDVGFRRLCAAAASGDDRTTAILTAAGRRVAQAAAVAVEIVDADEAVFGGPYWDLVEAFYLPECLRVLTGLHRVAQHEVSVTGSAMGHDVGAIGAAARVLDGHYVPRARSLVAEDR